MRSAFALPLLAVLALSGCQKTDEAASTTAAAPATPVSYEGFDVFGTAPADTMAVLPAEDVLGGLEEYVGKTVQVSGTIRQVCQAAGCWATIETDAGTVRLTVPKDSAGAYLFTMPKDMSGRRVIAEGHFDEKSIDADHARHMAEDAETQAAEHAEMEARMAQGDTAKASGEKVQEYQLALSSILVRKA